MVLRTPRRTINAVLPFGDITGRSDENGGRAGSPARDSSRLGFGSCVISAAGPPGVGHLFQFVPVEETVPDQRPVYTRDWLGIQHPDRKRLLDMLEGSRKSIRSSRGYQRLECKKDIVRLSLGPEPALA